MDDLISRASAESIFHNARKALMEQDRKEHIKDFNTRDLMLLNAEQMIHLLPSAEKTGWIPVKWHTITAEERERESYPEEWVNHVDCVMPEDEQEILITVKDRKGNTWVEKDTCYIDDGFYLDSGYDWIEDVLAWCELPTPYTTQEGEQDADNHIEYEEWNGIHAQITAPKGTFDRIFNDAEESEDKE